MLKSKKYLAIDHLNYLGCSCHNSKQKRRSVRKSAKRQEERAYKKDMANNY